ncbi:hypothetical protein THAOC_29957, partial [Thalassiosira oceanica]
MMGAGPSSTQTPRPPRRRRLDLPPPRRRPAVLQAEEPPALPAVPQGAAAPPNPSKQAAAEPRGRRAGSAGLPNKHRPRPVAQERSASVPPKKRHRWDNPGYVKGTGAAGIKAGGPGRRSTPFSRHHGPGTSGDGRPTTVGRAGRTVSADAASASGHPPEEARQQPTQP